MLKLDPGSRTTGLALVRSEPTSAGEVQHALQLVHLEHRGHLVHEHLRRRAGWRRRRQRRRRRSNLRYRPPRFLNRRRPDGWLAPSLRSRLGTVLTWARRWQRLVPLTRLDLERVTFDLQLLQHPELRGILYQRGELWGWEVRAYLLETFGRRCVYCKRTNGPLQLDHVLPRSRGGRDRVRNLVLACRACNHAKDDRTAAEWGHPEVETLAQAPRRDAAAVTATRDTLCDALRTPVDSR